MAQQQLAAESEQPDSPAKAPVPIVGYSAEVERLDAISDSVNALREIVMSALQSKNKSPPKPLRATRPETAVQRLRRKNKEQVRTELEAAVLPEGR